MTDDDKARDRQLAWSPSQPLRRPQEPNGRAALREHHVPAGHCLGATEARFAWVRRPGHHL